MAFLKALAVLLGTVIGVGIFSLPYAASVAGFPTMLFYFAVMFALVAWMHCIFAKILNGTKGYHRLPGLAGEYLGSFWKKLVFFVIAVGMVGSSIAYLIIGGEFLNNLLYPYFGGSVLFYTLIFFFFAAILVFKGIKTIANLELFLSAILLAVLAFISIKAAPFVNSENLTRISFSSAFFPYGIVLFSLWGSNVIPDLKEIVKKKDLNKVIVLGLLISALIYLFFTLIIFGVSGGGTSKDAISGLSATLGSSIVSLGYALGIIACFTSLITLSLSFKKTLWNDFGINKNLAWFIACFLPLFIFFLGIKKFIPVIAFTGAVSLGLESFVLIIIYKNFLKKKFNLKINSAYYLLALILILGAVFEIIKLI